MQNKFKAFLGVMTLVIMTGCATKPQDPVVINSNPVVSSKNVIIPKVEPTKLQNIRWQLMNEADLAAFLKANKGKPYIMYVLDQDNMKVEITNIQELRRYLKDQQAKIDYLLGTLKLNDPTPAADVKK